MKLYSASLLKSGNQGNHEEGNKQYAQSERVLFFSGRSPSPPAGDRFLSSVKKETEKKQTNSMKEMIASIKLFFSDLLAKE